MQLQHQVRQTGGLTASHTLVASQLRFCAYTQSFRGSCKSGNSGRIHASLNDLPCPDPVEPHAVLGVRPEASIAEIKRAFRLLALKHHPDVCSSSENDLQFLHIKAAYDSIMNIKRFGPPSHGRMNKRGEAGSDNSFFAQYYTTEEASEYNPWLEVLQQYMSRSTDDSKQTAEDTLHNTRMDGSIRRPSVSAFWEDW